VSSDSTTRALYKAAAAAGHAPSIHNTQPWRWRIGGETMDLFVERSRMLDVSDPDGHLAVLSCGTAVHHARLALAAHGWRATVTRLPDPADPDHLARLTIDGPAPIGPETERHAQNIRLRRTDRGPATGDPVGPDELHAITEAVESQSIHVHVLRSEQVYGLAAATSHAQAVETAEAEWQEELSRWAGGARESGAGVPDSVIPLAPPQTTVPGRDFGRSGELPPGEGHDQPAVFAVLYGSGDERIDWLRAGEALSALWLIATEIGVSVLPLSAAMEVVDSRETVRALLSGLGYPYLVVRLGHRAAADPATAQAPRLPVDQIIEHTH